jgi:hypothetical protein
MMVAQGDMLAGSVTTPANTIVKQVRLIEMHYTLSKPQWL